MNASKEPLPQTLAEALTAEAKLGEHAADIWGDERSMTPELFTALWPLLSTPIPPAYIVTVPATKGKPYLSTGIKSVQVQIDRMNNVLGPLCWQDVVVYQEGGKLAHVTIAVGRDPILLSRSSWGGVDRGSNLGNLYKGSYTSAAKVAFARIGVGHEVYCGATDLDPDVSSALANEGGPPAGTTKALAKQIVDHAWTAGEQKRLRLAASRLTGDDVGDCDTKAKATTALQALTLEQAEKLDEWLTEKKKGS